MRAPLETIIEAPSSGSELRLVVLGDELASSFPLPASGEVIVGRGEDAQVRIDHPSVSRRHARIRMGAQPILEDLGSSNGTRVGGLKLEPGRGSAELSPGTVVELGSVSCVVHRTVARAPGGRVRRIWTHSYFVARLEEECDRAEREGKTFCLMRVRVQGGEQDAIEEALASRLRAGDLLAVWAPGEYELLLLDATIERAAMLGRQVEGALEELVKSATTAAVAWPKDGRTPEQLEAAVNAALAGGDSGAPEAHGEDGLVIADPQMRRLHELAARVAEGTIPVLLLGESGVGKEIFAEAIHRNSPRKDQTFVRLNCAALSETLLESELFGYEKGAFTGALKARVGLLESANGGTVFLDELGEMPLSTQVKLLRVLEQREVLPVGALRPRPIDVRFVAATNRDLETEIAQGRFRQDLYFRLNGVALVIPPLRERPGEIELLAKRFSSEAAARLSRPAPTLGADVVALLQRYPWPGNIRELRNMMERAVLLSTGGRVTLEHLPVDRLSARAVPQAHAHVQTHAAPQPVLPPGALPPGMPSRSSTVPMMPAVSEPTTPFGRPLAAGAAAVGEPAGNDERSRILDALQRAGGNQKEAARLLGISRGTLLSRLDQFGIQRPRKRPGDGA